MSDPEACSGDMNEAEIAGCGFVVSRRQTTRVLEFVEATLDAVAHRIDISVDLDRSLASLARRNNSNPMSGGHVIPDVIRIIAFVADQDLWLGSSLHDETISLVIGDFAAGDLDGYRQAFDVGAEMNFGRKATF